MSSTSAWFRVLALLALPCLQLATAQHSTNAAAETDLKKLQLAPGLKLELVAAEPLLLNPVAFSMDERGRFFIAETHRYKSSIFDITQHVPWLLDDMSCRTVADREALLHRLFPGTNFTVLTNVSEIVRLVEDTDGDGRADKSTVLADGFNGATAGTAAGILARKGEAWFTCIPDLWKVSGLGFGASGSASQPTVASPANSKPKTPNPKQSLASGLGVHISVSGHDLHGLAFGPDGRIYFSIGDRGFELRPGMKHPGFSADYLRRIAPDTGAVFRCQPDGSDLEVFCIGMRNPQCLAFDALGNLFTVDNDTAGPDKCRLLHLVEGGDYGWRMSYQHMKNFGPWVTEELWRGGAGDILPWSGDVAQGPAGFAFYPGTGLPDRYTNHFFICDFPGTVWSFDVKPRGASFELNKREKLLWNVMPTHVAFGPDSALYVSDWVGGWGLPDKGRIYRISDPAQAGSAKLAEVKRLLGEGPDWKSPQSISKFLLHPDKRLRDEVTSKLWQDARLRSPVSEIENRVDARKLTLNRGASKKPLSPEQMLAEAKTPEDQFILTTILRREGRKDSVQAVVQMLRANADADPYLTHAGMMALLGIDEFDTIERAARDRSPAVRRAAMLCMQRLLRPEIARFLRDPDPRLVLEAARAINDAGIEPAYPALAALLDPGRRRREESLTSSPDAKPQTPDANQRLLTSSPTEPLLRRVLNAHYRLGHATNAQALATFAANTNSSDALRAEALFLLGAWEVRAASPGSVPEKIVSVDGHGSTPLVNPENWPAWFDRVCGLWRPLPPRPASPARDALRPRLASLLAPQAGRAASLPSTAPPVGQSAKAKDGKSGGTPDPRYAPQLAAIAAVEKLALTEAASDLAVLVKDAAQFTPVRVAALRTLGSSGFKVQSSKLLSDSVTLALSDSDTSVRREAVKLAAVGNPTTAVPLLERILATEKDPRLGQAALNALGDLPGASADSVLARQLALLTDGKLAPGLKLELLEAAAKRTSAAVTTPLQQFNSSLPKDDALAVFRPALAGGDAAEGKRTFHEHVGVQCLRCHAIRGIGGTVGPDLAGVGKRLTREQLLESIVFPNKTIAVGFENATLVLNGGANHSGLVKSETVTELVLDSPEDGRLTLKKADIEKRLRSLSAMPEGLDKMVTRRELRDLVEYLGGLK
ncbi:MAG: HEAT repeat domain-containing protein [Limisphaerales bacterium]